MYRTLPPIPKLFLIFDQDGGLPRRHPLRLLLSGVRGEPPPSPDPGHGHAGRVRDEDIREFFVSPPKLDFQKRFSFLQSRLAQRLPPVGRPRAGSTPVALGPPVSKRREFKARRNDERKLIGGERLIFFILYLGKHFVCVYFPALAYELQNYSASFSVETAPSSVGSILQVRSSYTTKISKGQRCPYK